MWGAYIQLDHNNKELTRRLLEEAAAAGDAGDAISRLVGNYFAAGMDEAAIAAAGAEPLRPYLDRIDAAGVRRGRPRHRRRPAPHRRRSPVRDRRRGGLRGRGRLPRLRPAGGPGPARARLLPPRRRAVGGAARCLRRPTSRPSWATWAPGRTRPRPPPRRSSPSSDAWPRRPCRREQQRDPKLTMNRFEVAALDELMPGLRPGRATCATSASRARRSASTTRPSSRPLDAALADTPLETLRDYLRWHLVRASASALAPAFEDEDVRVLRPHPRRPAGAAAPLEARRRRRVVGHRRGWSRSCTCESRSRRRPRTAVEEMVDHLLSRDGPRDPRQRLDDRDHARRGAHQARRLQLQDRLPGRSGATTRPWSSTAPATLEQPPQRRRVRDAPPDGPAGRARGQGRVGDAGPRRQRLLPPAAQRDRVPGRDPAAAVLLRGRRRRGELRRHRRR